MGVSVAKLVVSFFACWHVAQARVLHGDVSRARWGRLLAALTLITSIGANASLSDRRIAAEEWQGQWLGTEMFHCLQPAEVNWSAEQARTHCDWQTSAHGVLGFGITQGIYWLHLPVRFDSPVRERWLLEVAYALLEQVDFFVFDQGRLTASYRSGVPKDGGLLRYRHFVLPLQELRVDTDILIRVESRGSIQMPVALWKESAFIAKEAQNLLLVGGALGVMLAMMLYNFFIAVSSANRAYYHYAGMVLGLLLVQFSMHGFGERFLWGSAAFWNARVLPVSIGVTVFFANAFCDEFLQLEAQADPLRWGYRIVRWLALLLTLLTVYIKVDLALQVGVLLAVFGSLYTVVLILRHYTSHDRAIQFFCLGWCFFLAGVLLISFNKLGYLQRNFYTENFLLIGSLVELLMLSLALGERINQERTLKELAQARAISLERKEREAHATALRNEALTRKAQEIALNLQKESNGLQERKVEERSRALEDINQRLQELTRLDPLTGTRNRRFLNERLPEEYQRACRERSPLSVIMVDVDHFKQINDQFGHLVGDDCLKTVADLLDRMVTGPGAVVTRYGGEEFCILLPYTTQTEALEIAEKIRTVVASERMLLRGRALRVTVSIGVNTCVPMRDGKPEHLLDSADQAMYAAKKAGRNGVKFAAISGGHA